MSFRSLTACTLFPIDPGTLFETEDVEEFLAKIAGLTAHGGGDEPKPSIGAIIRAMDASEPGSPIFVFTDASASDKHRLNEVTSQVLKKNMRITFALVNSPLAALDEKRSLARGQTGSRSVYEHLAAISGGQFLSVSTNEIAKVASFVSFSAGESRSTIFRISDAIYGTATHSFPVDSSLEEVVISSNGQSISVSVITPQG